MPGSGNQATPWYRAAYDWCYSTYETLWTFSNREPLLTIRRVIWWGNT